ncbi:hypothetical protein SPONL_189 [uncultured Candidatus Thioglobus sp.]|nr:hypothetical protein SPONL_189 [uncultured Candidatus Thioglobus sp.]
MNKKLIAVIAATAMAGSIGFASVASAMEFNWYGSIRAGFDKQEADNRVSVATSTATDATGNIINPVAAPTITTTQVTATNAALDLGTGTAGSRFGIKGSEGLGNGLSAGFHIERSLTDSSLGLRHQNVWFKGRVGKLTLGQQNNPFRNAANW